MKLEFITLGVILAFLGAFAYVSSTGHHEWSGADNQAENEITMLTGGAYHPWTNSIYIPPSDEIESLLFALQAAIGSIIIGYFFGYYHAIAKLRTRSK